MSKTHSFQVILLKNGHSLDNRKNSVLPWTIINQHLCVFLSIFELYLFILNTFYLLHVKKINSGYMLIFFMFQPFELERRSSQRRREPPQVIANGKTSVTEGEGDKDKVWRVTPDQRRRSNDHKPVQSGIYQIFRESEFVYLGPDGVCSESCHQGATVWTDSDQLSWCVSMNRQENPRFCKCLYMCIHIESTR